MNQADKLKARDIIDTVVKGMEEGSELLYERAIVPAYFDVFMKQEDFDRLRPIFHHLLVDVQKALDAKLAALNRPKHKIMRFFGDKAVAQYERSLPAWYVHFKLHPNGTELAEGAFDVVAVHDLAAGPDLGEDGKTVRLRNESGSTRRMNFSPELNKAADTGAIQMTEKSQPPPQPANLDLERTRPGISVEDQETTRKVLASDVETKRDELAEKVPALGAMLADLRYLDGNVWQIVGIRQDRYVVGRGGKDACVDLRILRNNDISREHLIFRCDSDRCTFRVKDLSRYGTKLNGIALPSGAELGVDEGFVDLPNEAVLVLADVLELHFRSFLKSPK